MNKLLKKELQNLLRKCETDSKEINELFLTYKPINSPVDILVKNKKQEALLKKFNCERALIVRKLIEIDECIYEIKKIFYGRG